MVVVLYLHVHGIVDDLQCSGSPWYWVLGMGSCGFPPVALLLAFETLMYQLGLEQGLMQKSEAKEVRRAKKLLQQREVGEEETEEETEDDVQVRAEWLLKNDPDISGAALGRALGISSRHGRRLRNEIIREATEEETSRAMVFKNSQGDRDAGASQASGSEGSEWS